MTQKVYKTANGKVVDLGAIILQNESTLAVGNMGVNARGDKVAPTGKITERAKVVSAAIEDQVKKPKHSNVAASRKTAQQDLATQLARDPAPKDSAE